MSGSMSVTFAAWRCYEYAGELVLPSRPASPLFMGSLVVVTGMKNREVMVDG